MNNSQHIIRETKSIIHYIRNYSIRSILFVHFQHVNVLWREKVHKCESTLVVDLIEDTSIKNGQSTNNNGESE